MDAAGRLSKKGRKTRSLIILFFMAVLLLTGVITAIWDCVSPLDVETTEVALASAEDQATSIEPAEEKTEKKPIITNEVIIGIAEKIGIVSLLIGWVYAEYGKTESGLFYGDLVESLFPYYPIFVLIHAVAFLSCLWLATMDYIWQALVELSVVLIDCVLHWRILRKIVFYPQKRRVLAANCWREQLPAANEELLLWLYRLANAITLDSGGNIEQLAPIFMEGINEYSSWKPTGGNYRVGVTRLNNTASVWSCLLDGRKPEDCWLLAKAVLHAGPPTARGGWTKLSLRTSCAAYVLRLLMRESQKDESHSQDSYHTVMEIIADDIYLLERSDPSLKEEAQFGYAVYLEHFYTVLYWLLTIRGLMGSSDGNREPSFEPPKFDDQTTDVIEHAFAQCVFPHLSRQEIHELIEIVHIIMREYREDPKMKTLPVVTGEEK